MYSSQMSYYHHVNESFYGTLLLLRSFFLVRRDDESLHCFRQRSISSISFFINIIHLHLYSSSLALRWVRALTIPILLTLIAKHPHTQYGLGNQSSSNEVTSKGTDNFTFNGANGFLNHFTTWSPRLFLSRGTSYFKDMCEGKWKISFKI